MKLLICDDDILTVDVIESHLDRAGLGITQILRAYNGEAAKHVIAAEEPELVLCDIGMPLCDGIEVLKYVYDNRFETEFSLLTCHEDFEYAKAALQYGASHYITKPFEMEELAGVLRSMIEEATKKRMDRIDQNQARHDSVINSVLRQLSYGLLGSDRASVNAMLRQNGVDLSADSRWNMVLSCSDMTDALSCGWRGELLMYTASRLHDEVLAGYVGAAYTLLYSDERYLWCRCFVPAEACSREELFSRCRQLSQLCADHASLHPAILVGDQFPLYNASMVHRKLTNKMERLRFSPGVICGLEEADALCVQEKSYLDGAYLLRLLKEHSLEDFRTYISSVLSVLPGTPDDHKALETLRGELVYTFASCLRDNGLSSEAVFGNEAIAAQNAVSSHSSRAMLRFAETLYSTVEEQLQQLQDSADIIARVEGYIREHFRENISRNDVAAIVYITPNYLSKLFRSKMGMNLREYINRIRIEEARRLLLTTSLSVSEIAGRVGYDNISYFSTVFRKLVGMSPVDWRNSKREDGEQHDMEE